MSTRMDESKRRSMLSLPSELRLMIFEFLLYGNKNLITVNYYRLKPDGTAKSRSHILRSTFSSELRPDSAQEIRFGSKLDVSMLRVNRLLGAEFSTAFQNYLENFWRPTYRDARITDLLTATTHLQSVRNTSPATLATIKEVSITTLLLLDSGPRYTRYKDRYRWEQLCWMLSNWMGLEVLNLTFLCGRSQSRFEQGKTRKPKFTEGDFEIMINVFNDDRWMWLQHLTTIKGLMKLNINQVYCVDLSGKEDCERVEEYCASIEMGIKPYLVNRMVTKDSG